jgi:hypothetical protein
MWTAARIASKLSPAPESAFAWTLGCPVEILLRQCVNRKMLDVPLITLVEGVRQWCVLKGLDLGLHRTRFGLPSQELVCACAC